MAVIKKNEIIAPFLGAKLNFIAGQDPMGMLNIGEQIFSMLLPGLNNVTARIRYYSFYCWFFGWYAKSVGSENPNEQRKYLRRAEYLLALVAAKNNIDGIPGITEAQKNYNDDINEFSLLEGTGELKGTTEETYWKNPRGVFGQNYVSSLRQIGMIRDKGEDTGLFIRTAFDKDDVVTGKDLEDAFDLNLDRNATSLFSKAVISGNITQIELVDLSSNFNMIKVPLRSKENHLLIEMLLGADHPISDSESFFRRTTIKLYLNLLKDDNSMVSVQDFANFSYYQQGLIKNVQDDTLMAWYYYQLSQYWHIVSTSCLKTLLDILQQKCDSGWYVESDLVNEISKDLVEYLSKENYTKKSSTFNTLSVLKDDNVIITNKIHSCNNIESLSYSFLLLKKLMNDNSLTIQKQLRFAQKHKLNSSSDFIAVYLDLEKNANRPIGDFISYFLKKYIINRHQLVALNKMNATQSTEKFIREDGLIRLVDSIHFGFSSPRLGNLIEFLKDLNIISDDKTEITKMGTKVHKKINA